ncbi:MAG: rhodanese-like domain-containing protein [Actinomycetota bacterium]
MRAPGDPEFEFSSGEVARRLEAGDIQLLDVREQMEWDAGRPSGAVHVPMQTIPARIDELDRTKPVACICLMGARSAMVAEYLRAQGFEAYNVSGGFREWFQERLPTEPDDARVVQH